MDNILEGVRKVHLIGIGGIGMSGIGEYLGRKKYEVSGSDLNLTSLTKRLENYNIKVSEGHDENNLPDDVDLVIYSSAVKEDNPELQKAKRLNKKTVKRAEALGNIVKDKFVISVSGTHGKTTTTAMISKALIENNLDPTVFVGGNIDFLNGGSSRIGESNIAVVEADEYDRSFLELSSNIIVITNIDPDHLDIYKDIEDIKDTFKKFIDKGKKDLKIIAFGDDKNVTDTLRNLKNKTLYGFKAGNDSVIDNISYGRKNIMYSIGGDDIRLKVLGKHNILNSSAAYLVAQKFSITDEKFNQSMETFYGVKRRLELKYEDGFRVYDDYAHHPEEVKASLEAIRKTYPQRVITVFQPHLYSRTRDFYREFAEVFLETDVLILAKIYPAREKEIEGISSELILDEYNNKTGIRTQANERNKIGSYLNTDEKILEEIEKITMDGDVIIFQGAGDITDLCSKYVRKIKAKSNRKVPL